MAADWIRRYRPEPAAVGRVLFFPHAGGSASYFFPMVNLLSPQVEVLAVQYPGRQDRMREACLESASDMADAIFQALEQAPFDGLPVCFYGHSMGAVLAFEVALRCQAAGRPGPTALIVSGRRSPTTPRVETVHLRDDAGVLDEVRALGGTEAALFDDADVREMILPAIRGDYTLIETYQHAKGNTVGCPITALIGSEDQRTTEAEGQAWAEVTTSDFELLTFPGGHFFITAQLDPIAKLIRAAVSG